MVDELVFDDDVFDRWVLRRRKPASEHYRPKSNPLEIDLDIENPWLVKPREDGKNAYGIETRCGTYAMWNTHNRRHEPIDDACREARNAWYREYKRKRKEANVKV